MKEKIITGKKHGMAVLILDILLLLAAFPAVICGGCLLEEEQSIGALPLIIGGIILCVGWFPLCGLRVLKPQEALVLTLFGKYIGTLKGEGFYAINPFCSSVNPAAKTKLSQSGDVDNNRKSAIVVGSTCRHTKCADDQQQDFSENHDPQQ